MSGMKLLAGRLCSSDCPPTFSNLIQNHSTAMEKTSEKFEVKGLLKT